MPIPQPQEHGVLHSGNLRGNNFLYYEREPRFDDSITLQQGDACVTIARQGAAIDTLTIGSTLVLARAQMGDEEQAPARHNTTHSMFPYSRNRLQPAHGTSRYLNYNICHATASQVNMDALDPLTGLHHHQQVEVSKDGITITDALINRRGQPINTSFGKHPYIATDRNLLDLIEITDTFANSPVLKAARKSGKTVTGTFGELSQYIAGMGETLICQNVSTQHVSPDGTTYYTTDIIIALPDPQGTKLRLEVTAEVEGRSLPTQLAFWRPPFTDQICIKPLVGVRREASGTLKTNLLRLKADQALTFTTRITVGD